MSNLIVLTFTDLPPSMNKIGGHTHWSKYQWHKKKWQNMVLIEMSRSRLSKPLLAPVIVWARLRFPTNRARDEGNFRMMLEKVVGDAFVKGDWLPDDTPDCYRFREVEFEEERGAPQTILFIQEGDKRPVFTPES